MLNYQETLFFTGEQHFDALIEDIKRASTSIDLETYMFQNDPVGHRVAHALTQAAKRGLRVRVMVDGAGTPFWSFASSLEKAGAATKVFHPFPWQLWNWSRSFVKLPIFLKWIYLLWKINFRNHRKVCIIDNSIAYVGSLNIGKWHLSKDNDGYNWKDISVRLSHADVSELSKAFDAAWHHRTIPERLREAFWKVRQDPPIRLNYTRHRRRILYKQLLRKMALCQRRIWITNAYFVPDNFLLRTLKEAAQRNVDVRILLPQKSDVFMMPWAASTFYRSLLKAGVRIFEYLPSILHAKALILDDWMQIGSSNLNYRSLLHDLEADINISTPAAKKLLEDNFLKDLMISRELSLHSWERWRPKSHRILGNIVLYIKYWI